MADRAAKEDKTAKAVGRPRRAEAPVSGDPRGDIIAAAARLFRAKGIAGASVREIAEEAGLRKASLYYYFPSKEEIVYAMIEGVLGPALDMQRRLGRAELSEPARLWLYLRFDVEMLCSAPYDCTWLLSHASLSGERMAGYWTERQKLIAWLTARLKQGQAKGEIRECDAAAAAKALLAATEYSVTWAERENRRRMIGNAEEVATLLVRGLLSGKCDFDAVMNEVRDASGVFLSAN